MTEPNETAEEHEERFLRRATLRNPGRAAQYSDGKAWMERQPEIVKLGLAIPQLMKSETLLSWMHNRFRYRLVPDIILALELRVFFGAALSTLGEETWTLYGADPSVTLKPVKIRRKEARALNLLDPLAPNSYSISEEQFRKKREAELCNLAAFEMWSLDQTMLFLPPLHPDSPILKMYQQWQWQRVSR